MKNNKYFKAYGIDLTYEINTYKHIGNDYGDSKTANLGFDFNVLRWMRKNVTNKNEKKYKICDKYSEWKKYIIDKLPTNISNKEDMIHFFNKNRIFAVILYDLIKIVLIPIYIAMLEVIEVIWPNPIYGFVGFLIIAIVIVVIACGMVIDTKQKIHFYDDCLSILEERD